MTPLPRDVRLLLRLFPRGEEGEVVVGDLLETVASGGPGTPGWSLRLHVIRSLAAVWSERVRRGTARVGRGAFAGLGVELASAGRLLLGRPGLALGVTGSIALGVGATTVGVSLVDGLLRTEFPYPDAARVVRLVAALPDGERTEDLSLPDIDALGAVPGLTTVAPVARVRMVVPGEEGAYRLRGEAVGASYAELVAPALLLGRFPSGADFEPGSPSRIVLGERAWRSRFGADPDILGRQIRSDAALHEVVGVARASFFGTTPEDLVDFWVPIVAWAEWETVDADGRLHDPHDRWVRAVGRVEGRPPARGGQPLGTFAATAGVPPGTVAVAAPLSEGWLEGVRAPLRLLLAAAGCLLLLGAVNVAALMGARLLERRGELGVRMALGASRSRVLRGLFAEALVLVTVGALTGAVLAAWSGGPIGRLLLSTAVIPEGFGPRLGGLTLLLIAAASAAFALVVALVPPALLGRGVFRITPGRVRGAGAALPTRVLNGAQVAVATVLLFGTGLLLRSYAELSAVDLGYRTEGMLRMQVTAADARYPTLEQRRGLVEDALAAVRAQPGVRDAALVGPSGPPFSFLQGTVTAGPDPRHAVRVDVHAVSEGFSRVLDVPLVAGRDLGSLGGTRSDVVTVSRSVAERLGGPERAVGATLTLRVAEGEPVSVEVVGVVEDVLFTGAADPRPAPLDLYLSIERWPRTFFSVLVDVGAVALDEVVPALRRSLGGVDAAAAIHWIDTLDRVMADDAVGLGRRALLIAIVAGLALVMAALGLWGMLAYSGRRRRGEFAIRGALGASPTRVGGMVLADGLASVGGGVLCGFLFAIPFVGAMRGLLFGVGPADPGTVLAVVGVFTLVGLVAAGGPAVRASRQEPARALVEDA